MNAKQNFQISNELTPMPVRTMLLIETPAVTLENQLNSKLASQDIKLIAVLKSTIDLVNHIESKKPDMLVLSVDILGTAMLDQLIKVNETCPLPVTVFAKQHTAKILKAVLLAGISSYVVDDDVQAHRLPIIFDLAVIRFEQMTNLNNELKQTKEKLSQRKIIERAKGILMQQKRLSENQAYDRMRKTAMNKGQSMAELAQRIISVFEIIGSSD